MTEHVAQKSGDSELTLEELKAEQEMLREKTDEYQVGKVAMVKVETDSGASADSQSGTRPYAPSWVDLLGDWVDRRHGQNWLYYFGLGVVVLLVQAIVLWIEGASTLSNFGIAQVYLVAVVAYMLALIQYLDNRAGVALETGSGATTDYSPGLTLGTVAYPINLAVHAKPVRKSKAK
jgi:hypothetical protein